MNRRRAWLSETEISFRGVCARRFDLEGAALLVRRRRLVAAAPFALRIAFEVFRSRIGLISVGNSNRRAACFDQMREVSSRGVARISKMTK
jgi:hypothetical protein